MDQQNFSHSSMLATAIPTRRSPRAVERLCNGMTPPGMTADQTATLLALAHCTGWSADRIAHKLKDVTDLELSAEVVWSVHDIWVKERGGEHLEADDIEMMHVLLRRTGVDMPNFGVPLNRTEYPKSVKFAECWSPKNAPDCPLFNGFTTEARKRSKSYLSYVERQSAYGKFTPIERELVTQFGSTIALILQDVLKRWARAMRAKLRVEPELRPIRDLEHVCLIIDYLEIFRDSYESKFGKMEDSNRGQLGETKDGCVYITSTGYGAKIFLGLMMADRIHVIDRQRRHMREKIGFVDLDISMLGDDSKTCPICHDPMSVENPEGIKEDPIELTICCSQVIGRRCLKAWLREFFYGDMLRDTCPICRFKFPETFMEKLFEIGEYKDRLILQHRHESTESG